MLFLISKSKYDRFDDIFEIVTANNQNYNGYLKTAAGKANLSLDPKTKESLVRYRSISNQLNNKVNKTVSKTLIFHIFNIRNIFT